MPGPENADASHEAGGSQGPPTPPGETPRGPTPPGAPPPGGPPSGATPAAAPRPSSDPHERIDGIRSWLADVDRKLGTRTYIGAAAVVLAIAAAAVAVVLTMQTRDDAAQRADLDAIQTEISGVEEQASQAAQQDVASLSEQIDELEQRVDRISSDSQATDNRISVIEDDIEDLRNEVSNQGGGSP